MLKLIKLLVIPPTPAHACCKGLGLILTILLSLLPATQVAAFTTGLGFWRAGGVSISYDGNGGTGSVPSVSPRYPVGRTVTVAANAGLTRTGYIFAGWNTAANGSGSNYAAGSGSLTMGATDVTLYAKWNVDFCSGLAGGTWVTVPGDSIYGTSDFCVQKYIPSNNGSNVATSQAGSSPWVSISQTDAKTTCSALGTGYHLITNPEWMTIAANLANVGSNWSSGTVGNGELTRGHSDNSPAQACPADANDANAWVDGDCTGKVKGTLQFRERRTRSLSNGSVVWDLGGNVWQWVDAYDPNGKPGTATLDWNQYSAMGNGTVNWPRSAFVPLTTVQFWWNIHWNSDQSIGQIYPGSNGTGGALNRGGYWTDYMIAGPFSAALTNDPSSAGTYLGGAYQGFRCAHSPNSYTVSYNANGATSGTAPTDSTAYSQTRPVTVASNTGTLAKTGFNFSGWNTAANGSGTDYATGATLTMGTANVTLYAKWSSCGESSANNCYTGANSATLQAAGTTTTPLGKSISYVFANGSSGVKVWRETGGTRILAANGLDQWSKALNVSGVGQSATDFSDANIGTASTLIEGRVCPGNVYIDASNKFTTTNCLYYTPSYAEQTLNAAGTSQTSLGTTGLAGWDVAGTGNGTDASWYEGNIQTCASKGMRLPALYETVTTQPAMAYQPTVDGTPTAWGGANGVPSAASWTYTASAYTGNSGHYWVWSGSSTGLSNYSSAYAVRCVVP